jgi:hypothetical protein
MCKLSGPSLAYWATKKLNLQPNNIHVVHELRLTDFDRHVIVVSLFCVQENME